MRLLYNFLIRFFGFSALLAAPFNARARQWHRGRKGLLKKIRKDISKEDKLIWFHCASLGEFEQGRPVIEAVKSTFSDHKILLTFFSPSGFEVRKNYAGADFIYYLPLDTAVNAKKFINRTKPRMVFFIKYEFWFNYINELNKNKIPLFIVSAIFRKSQYFFKPGAGWIRKQLQKVTYFFVQNQDSLELLYKANVFHADISGDTRFDTVVRLANEKISLPEVEKFADGKELFVAGSTWPADEEIVRELLKNTNAGFKLIIAPHIVEKERIDQLLKVFEEFKPVLYSKAKGSDLASSGVMIVNSIGKLAYMYRYGKYAYIGGGFGVGIHNTLEAATYGLPVIFGPTYKRFKEAVDMVELGCAFPVVTGSQLTEVVDSLNSDQEKYALVSSTAKKYVREHAGATQNIIEKSKEYLLVP